MSNEKEADKYKELFADIESRECQACGGPLNIEKVNLEDYQGGKLYLMEHVPALVCQSCGENWIPEPILREFENMIKTAKSLRKKQKTTKRRLKKK